VLVPTEIVMLALPAPGAAIGLGLMLTVVPAGTPAADSVTALLKPLLTVVMMFELPWPPCPHSKKPAMPQFLDGTAVR
jgi:hypothetical protein